MQSNAISKHYREDNTEQGQQEVHFAEPPHPGPTSLDDSSHRQMIRPSPRYLDQQQLHSRPSCASTACRHVPVPRSTTYAALHLPFRQAGLLQGVAGHAALYVDAGAVLWAQEEMVAYVRRRSSAFSRGKSRFRGVSGHAGRWEARIGAFAGRKNVSHFPAQLSD